MSAAPRAGADLRAARERLNWQLDEAAAALRIRKPHLEALEDGDLDRLPGNAFALGFLRSYATALGLDPDEMLRRFRSEAAEVSRRTELSFPAPVPERGLPAGAVMLLGLIIAVVAYIGWYRLSGEGRLPAETATTIPERLTPLAQQALPPSASPVIAPTLAPTAAAAAPVSPPVTPAPAVIPPPTMPAAARVVVRATGDAWVEVRDKSGTVILNKVLHAGDTWPAPATPGLTMTTGNAAATDILLDGVAIGNLGGNGIVRHDVPLDYDQLKTGKLVQAAPRPPQ